MVQIPNIQASGELSCADRGVTKPPGQLIEIPFTPVSYGFGPFSSMCVSRILPF